MVRDRLKEFREAAGLDSEVVTITSEGSEDQKQLLDLLDKIGPLYTKLKDMNIVVCSLRGLIYEHDSQARLEDGFNKVKSDARKLRTLLDEIKETSTNGVGVVQHAANTHHLSLILHLTMVLQELSKMPGDSQDRHHQYVRKDLLLTGQGSINESELDSLLDQSTEIFTRNLIQETQVARQQLQDLQERHEAIIRLEKSIEEVRQLFQDVGFLVQQQGDSINRIENYVFESQTKTEGAEKQLGKALVKKRKSMKEKLICVSLSALRR